MLYRSNLVRIPPEIGAMTSLEEFTPYTSYRLHWFPRMVEEECGLEDRIREPESDSTPRQDTSAPGWQHLLELVDEAAADGREEFRAEQHARAHRAADQLPASSDLVPSHRSGESLLRPAILCPVFQVPDAVLLAQGRGVTGESAGTVAMFQTLKEARKARQHCSKQRCRLGRESLREEGQLGDRAGRSDLQRAFREQLHRCPAGPAQVHQTPQVRLLLGEEIRTAAEPGVARPSGRGQSSVPYARHCVQVHDHQ